MAQTIFERQKTLPERFRRRFIRTQQMKRQSLRALRADAGKLGEFLDDFGDLGREK
jgi:uncharacterized protein VirK/YbjX